MRSNTDQLMSECKNMFTLALPNSKAIPDSNSTRNEH